MFPIINGVLAGKSVSPDACVVISSFTQVGVDQTINGLRDQASVAINENTIVGYRHSGFNIYAYEMDGTNTDTYYAGAFGDSVIPFTKAKENEAVFVSRFDRKVRSITYDTGTNSLSLDLTSVSSALSSHVQYIDRLEDYRVISISDDRILRVLVRSPGGGWATEHSLDISADIPSSSVIGIGAFSSNKFVVLLNGTPQTMRIYEYDSGSPAISLLDIVDLPNQESGYDAVSQNDNTLTLFSRNTVDTTGYFYESYCWDGSTLVSQGNRTQIDTNTTAPTVSLLSNGNVASVRVSLLQEWEIS